MVKKTGRGKEKKLARKAENARAAAVAARVRELNDAWSGAGGSDPLASQYLAFTRYERKGLAAALHFYPGAGLPPALLDWALGLTRQHMAPLYDGCPGWGWSDARKCAELADPAARFVVAFEQPAAAAPVNEQQQPQGAAAAAAAMTSAAPTAALQAPAATPTAAAAEHQENSAAAGNGGGGGGDGGLPGRPLAFLHFRIEEEEGAVVFYCYEVQVEAAAQGKGLGRFLMQLLELAGRRAGADRLMLTVLHANAGARALYARLGYGLDESSPNAINPSDTSAGYSILCKHLPQPAAAAPAAAAP